MTHEDYKKSLTEEIYESNNKSKESTIPCLEISVLIKEMMKAMKSKMFLGTILILNIGIISL